MKRKPYFCHCHHLKARRKNGCCYLYTYGTAAAYACYAMGIDVASSWYRLEESMLALSSLYRWHNASCIINVSRFDDRTCLAACTCRYTDMLSLRRRCRLPSINIPTARHEDVVSVTYARPCRLHAFALSARCPPAWVLPPLPSVVSSVLASYSLLLTMP